jgi:phenylacetate-CoA ligase
MEIINPDTLEPIADGEIGELVLTTLDRQAMPILRYRTRDLTRIIPGVCPCGRTHRIIDRIKGRTDDMFIIRGCNVFPMQIEKVLMQIPELESNYLITLETIEGIDEMIIEVEAKLKKNIVDEVRNEVLITPKVKLVESSHFPPCDGKALRVKDNRKLF